MRHPQRQGPEASLAFTHGKRCGVSSSPGATCSAQQKGSGMQPQPVPDTGVRRVQRSLQISVAPALCGRVLTSSASAALEPPHRAFLQCSLRARQRAAPANTSTVLGDGSPRALPLPLGVLLNVPPQDTSLPHPSLLDIGFPFPNLSHPAPSTLSLMQGMSEAGLGRVKVGHTSGQLQVTQEASCSWTLNCFTQNT